MKIYVKLSLISALILCLFSLSFATDPGIFDITIQAGEDYTLDLTETDETGAAVDLTGSTIRAQARKTVADATPFANFSTAITSPTEGKWQLSLSHLKTAPLRDVSGVYDVKRTSAAGVISYPVKGIIRIQSTVTR